MGFNKPKNLSEKEKMVRAEQDFKLKTEFLGKTDDVLKAIRERREKNRGRNSFPEMTEERKKDLASISYFAYRNVLNGYKTRIREEQLRKEIRASTSTDLEFFEVLFIRGVMIRQKYLTPCNNSPSYFINRDT